MTTTDDARLSARRRPSHHAFPGCGGMVTRFEPHLEHTSEGPKLCLRLGCGALRGEDRLGLGLCDAHTDMVARHELGAPRAWKAAVERPDTATALRMIEEMMLPGESLRAFQRRSGIGKDTVHHLKHRMYGVIRPAGWEAIRFAHARHRQGLPLLPDAEDGAA